MYPLQFFIKADGTFDPIPADVIAKINSGRGNAALYPPDGTFITVGNMFGATIPESITTYPDGTNNIQSAKSVRWVFYVQDSALDSETRKQWEFEYEDYCK